MTDAQISRIGQVKVEGEKATLVFERLLPHPIETAWEAITKSDELSKWYMEAKIETRAGGEIEFYSERGGMVNGKILTWDPPHIFEHEWIVDRPGSPKGEYGIIRWELQDRGNFTLLKLTHRNLPKQSANYFAPGAHAIVDRLEAHLNKAPLPEWNKQVEELQASYARGS